MFKKINKARAGFTLIELLVVIAIIGVLASIVLASLNTARQKGRDARRISDIRQIQLALELYLDACGGYPSQAAAGVLTTGLATGCPAGTTFGTFLAVIPANPTPPSTAAFTYTYCSTTNAAPTTCAASGERYLLTFSLEGQTGSLAAGAHSAQPGTIQ